MDEQGSNRRRAATGEPAQRRSEALVPGRLVDGGVAPGDEPGCSFLALVVEACGEESARAAGWRAEPDPSRFYVRVRNYRIGVPEQGWKLHISASVDSARAVLGRVLPVLVSGDASFKVVASVSGLGLLNEGRRGLSQVGKFVTVYPNSDAEAVRLAAALDEATRSLSGPAVPSDLPLVPGSLVHYRYGGFGARLVQVPSGEVVPVISTPAGELVPDRRSSSYYAPGWTLDPFAAAGVARPSPPRSSTIGGRYTITSTPYRSPAGAVHNAIDTEALCRCVIKQRRRDTRAYLRNEAAVLARLAPDPRFPAVLDLIEGDNGDLFMVMEEVEGETLGRHVGKLARVGRHASGERVVAWGRELAAILAKVHEEGLVYRDLKTENVILAPDGRLGLLDFEYACEAGERDALGGAGTCGYASPQRAADEPPAIADDIYALGALLYAVLTGTAPPRAPRPFDLPGRPVELLNPAAGPGPIAVISRCLDPDPASRYPSMTALDAALAQARPRASVEPAPFGGEPLVEEEAEARGRYRDLARRIGDAICGAARPAPDGRGVMWPARMPGGGEVPLRDLSAGAGGTLLALAELVEEIEAAGHRAVLREGARWLVGAPRISKQPLPGLYVGEAGVGAALLRAGQVLGDDELVAAAVEKGRLVSALPHVSPDLFTGTAGRLRFHLLLHGATGEEEHLRHATEAGEVLLDRAEDDGTGPRWTIPPGYGATSGCAYLGYAHGAAGIADALLDLFEATQDERFLAAARGTGRLLARLAVPVLDDGSGLDWPVVEGGPPAGAVWCHGAAGIGGFFLRAAALDVLPGAADIAARAARTVARGARHIGPIQCHGLAGNIGFLLDAYRATGHGAYLAEARSLARLLEAFGREREGVLHFPSDAPDVFVPHYMTGYAGVAVCFLRLSIPEQTPRAWSRRRLERDSV